MIHNDLYNLLKFIFYFIIVINLWIIVISLIRYYQSK